MFCPPAGYGVLADVSSVSPSSEQTGELLANQCFKLVGNKFMRIEKFCHWFEICSI